MIKHIFLQTFLFGVVMSEWVEITKVGHTNPKPAHTSNKGSSTLPSYEITLNRPQFYEITTQTDAKKTILQFPMRKMNMNLQRDNEQSNTAKNYTSPHRNTSKSNHSNSDKTMDQFSQSFMTISNKVTSSIATNKTNDTKNTILSNLNSTKDSINNRTTDNFNTNIEKYSKEDFNPIIETRNVFETQIENILAESTGSLKEDTQSEDELVSIEDDKEEYEDDEEEYEDEKEENEQQQENNQENSKDIFANFMSMMKHVQKELLNFKGRSLSAKIGHLEKLRDNILYEIKYRIQHLFKPPKKLESESRTFKGMHPDGEYHMEYPSNEGAIMTIGFLFFAVFLIKLVLKTIFAMKLQQHYAQTTTTPASIFLKRTNIGPNREVNHQDQLEESARIMRYLEEYSPS